VTPRIFRNSCAILPTLPLLALFPLAIAQPARGPVVRRTPIHDSVTVAGVSRAIDLSAHYLESAEFDTLIWPTLIV